MEISTERQLVPYYQAPKQLSAHSSQARHTVMADSKPAATPYSLILPPPLSKHSILPDGQGSVYNSSRRLKDPEINQVGLLIDIYA